MELLPLRSIQGQTNERRERERPGMVSGQDVFIGEGFAGNQD
jgi:hypothetical protein